MYIFLAVLFFIAFKVVRNLIIDFDFFPTILKFYDEKYLSRQIQCVIFRSNPIDQLEVTVYRSIESSSPERPKRLQVKL